MGESWVSAQSRKKITRPFLYKISKNDKAGYVLGSCHVVPLSFFSEEILDIITNCQNFIGESAGNKPISHVDLQNSGLLTNPEKAGEDWFKNLDEPIKNYLFYFFKYIGKNIHKEVKIGEMMFKFAVLTYRMGAHQLYSMDQHIEDFFPKNNVYSLEEFDQTIGHILSHFSSCFLEEWQVDKGSLLNGINILSLIISKGVFLSAWILFWKMVALHQETLTGCNPGIIILIS